MRILWVAVFIAFAGCFGGTPNPVEPEPPDRLDGGAAHWTPLGDFSWERYERQADGTWVLERHSDDATGDFLDAFAADASGQLRLQRGPDLLQLDDARITQWTVSGGPEGVVERVVFTGAS